MDHNVSIKNLSGGTMNETKAARDCETIQFIQSNCVHRRRDFIPKDPSGVMHCLDCGKFFYGEESRRSK